MSATDRQVAALRLDLAEQRAYVRDLFDSCCAQGHPEYWGMLAVEPLVQINAIRARIEALLHPGKRWIETVH
jgi:hypothetical protein